MKLTLGRKLAFAFGAILTLAALGTIFTLAKLTSLRQMQDLTLNVRVPSLAACKDLQRDLNQAQSKGRQTILAGAQHERSEAAQKLFESTWEAIDKDVSTLDGLAPRWLHQENRDRLTELKQHLPLLRSTQESAMRLARRGKGDDIVRAGNEFADKATAETEAIKKQLDGLADYFQGATAQNIRETDDLTRSLYLTLIATTLIALAIGATVATLMSRSISHISQLVLQQAHAISSGDLTRENLAVRSKDELGDLTAMINKVNDSLKNMIHSIAENAEHVATASEEFSSTSQQISANSEETSAQATVVSNASQVVSQNLQSVSTGAEEMGSTIQSIAGNAHEAASVASKAVKSAEEANATVAKLGESSAEIGEVIKVITSIAQQTKLLALNATIEAARAGEAGKGFAVVANEVKELAKQTAQATEDIGHKIVAIQGDTQEAVEAIGGITKVINQINDISGTIATAVEEQSATTNEMTRNVTDAAKGSEDITHNIAGVAEAARGTSHSAHESQKAADELAQMAVQLRGLVQQFKIDHGAGDGTHEARSRDGVKSMAAASGQ